MQRLEENNSSDCVRGPHLANIEIERQRCLNGNPNNSKLMEALVKYFHRFVLVNLFPAPLSAVVYFESLNTVHKYLVLFKRLIFLLQSGVGASTMHIPLWYKRHGWTLNLWQNPDPVSSQLRVTDGVLREIEICLENQSDDQQSIHILVNSWCGYQYYHHSQCSAPGNLPPLNFCVHEFQVIEY